VIDSIRATADFTTKAKMLRTKADNKALALQAAELFKVEPEVSEKVIESFSGLKGRQELVKKIEGVEYYNDSASVTPLATLSALKKLSRDRNCILILGGSYTGFDYSELVQQIPMYAKSVILLPGSGSLGFRKDIEALPDINFFQMPTLEEALICAKGIAKKEDIVLFSPGCEAVGVYNSRKERGEKFVKAVRTL
jgi:UDP-N-acetylmuramoylalanine--D-glutamate ligase